MIFRQVDKVRSGEKRQTRRVVKIGEVGFSPQMRGGQMTYIGVQQNGRWKWWTGSIYPAIPKMYQKSFGRICIEWIRQEHLHDITEADAIAEGVASVEEYKALWESINGKTKGCRWDDNPLVWVIKFLYLGDVVPEAEAS